MRRVLVGVGLLALGLVRCAYATDYELTVDVPADQVIKQKGLTVYEPYGLIKPGDRIVSLLAGPLPKPSMSCRVVFGLSDNSKKLGGVGMTQGFQHGEIRLINGNGPEGSYKGALLMHVVAPPPLPKDHSVVGGVSDFFHERPWIWILMGGVGLAFLIVAGMRINANANGIGPAYGKRAYHDNLREVKSRLDRVIEGQEFLVRKPPVLRAFRKQIERFDKRLEKLEITAVTTHQALSVLASSVVEVQVSVQALNGQTDRVMEGLAALESTIVRREQEAKSSEDGAHAKFAEQAAQIEQIKTLLSQRVEFITAAVKNAEQSLAGRVDTIQKEIASIEALRAMVAKLDSTGAHSAAELKAAIERVEAAGAKHSDIEPLLGIPIYLGAVAESINKIEASVGEKFQASLEAQLSALATQLETQINHSSASIHQTADTVVKAKASIDALAFALKNDENAKTAREQSQALSARLQETQKAVSDLAKALAQLSNDALRQKEFDKVASAIESKLTAIQSLGTVGGDKKGKGDVHVAPESLTAFSELVEQLASETRNRQKLEKTFAGITDSLNSLPKVVSTLENRLSAVETVRQGEDGGTQIDIMPLVEQLMQLQAAMGTLPEQVRAVEEGLTSTTLHLSHTQKTIAQALQHLSNQVSELTQNGTVPHGEATSLAPLSIDIEEPAFTPAAFANDATEDTEEIEDVSAGSKGPKAKLAPQLSVPEPDEEPEDAPTFGSEFDSWICAGGTPSGRWSVHVKSTLTQNPEADAAKPLTPTETPGIEYPIGAMVFAKGKVVYAHGDIVRGYWPGTNERSVSLAHPIPEEPWRVLLLGESLFCAQGPRVDVIDIGSWARGAGFGGEYVAQTATNTQWAGIRKDKHAKLEFREPNGDLNGQPFDLPAAFNEDPFLVSDGRQVFAASKDGKLFRATREGVTELDSIGGRNAKVVHLAAYKKGVIALVETSGGIVLRRVDSEGNLEKELKTDAGSMSGNAVVIADRVYFFSPEHDQILVCDAKNGRLLGGIDVPDVKTVRQLAGLSAVKMQSLLVYGCDQSGKSGSVFVLDPRSGDHVTLCSVGQPHVDVLWAGPNAVVATSSTYQNIVRVFEPYKSAQAVDRAA